MLLIRVLCYYGTIKQTRAWSTTLLQTSERRNFAMKANSGSTYGGDFAGLSALVDVEKGCVKKVPDHLLPASFIEWEVKLYGLEALTSEELSENTLHRVDMEVLPEAGCGVDNLEVLTSKPIILIEESTSSTWEEYNTEFSSIMYEDKFKNMILECIFLHLDKQSEDRFRSRISLSFDSTYSFLPKKPIKYIYERQTSPNSSHGKVAEGGGLDARTVTTLIGPDIRSDQLFEDPSSFIDKHILEGNWKILERIGTDENESYSNTASSENISCISLPSKTILRYWKSNDVQYIEISSHVDASKRIFITYAIGSEGIVAVDHCLKEMINSS